MTVSEVQLDKAAAARTGVLLRISANLEVLAAVCNQFRFPFYLGLTIMEKESHGENVYGHDVGGALTGFDGDVNAGNYGVFRWLVDSQGMKSNGVGPFQITWSGHFTAMAARKLDPWRPRDNIAYGVEVLSTSFATYLRRGQPVRGAFWSAARDYSGKDPYADDAALKASSWYSLLGAADVAPAFNW